MKGPLAWRIGICRFGIERIKLTAILKHKAQSVGDQARTHHSAVIGLNDGNHHAVLVRRGEIRGVAVEQMGIAGTDGGIGVLKVDVFAAHLGVAIGNQTLHGLVHEARIGVVLRQIFIRKTFGLEHGGECVRAAPTHFFSDRSASKSAAFRGWQSLVRSAATRTRHSRDSSPLAE